MSEREDYFTFGSSSGQRILGNGEDGFYCYARNNMGKGRCDLCWEKNHQYIVIEYPGRDIKICRNCLRKWLQELEPTDDSSEDPSKDFSDN